MVLYAFQVVPAAAPQPQGVHPVQLVCVGRAAAGGAAGSDAGPARAARRHQTPLPHTLLLVLAYVFTVFYCSVSWDVRLCGFHV